jgi:hypothetical protein
VKTTRRLDDEAQQAALARAKAGLLLGPADMGALFQFGNSRFARGQATGEFDRFKVQHPIGKHCFSGTLVYRYLQGERIEEPVFGRKATTRRQA